LPDKNPKSSLDFWGDLFHFVGAHMNDPGREEYPDLVAMTAQMEPGSVLYGFAAGEDLQIEVLIRETSEEILRTGPKPEIEIRSGLLQQEKVWVTVVLFQLRSGGPVYVSWWNYHHPAEDPEAGSIFDHMAAGNHEILLKLVGDKGSVERLLPFTHPLSTFFRQAQRRLATQPPWSMEEFMEAIQVVRETYESPQALWAALS
jgi:hypothetical protein